MSGPGEGSRCGHADCLFERDCLVLQAETELQAARADRLDRRDFGLALARCMGLTDDEGPLFEVAFCSPNMQSRIAAGDLLVDALRRVVAGTAA